MPIKEPLLFISVEDFKNWKGFDKLLFENVTNSDENIWFAISIASSNIDYLSGFAISKKWPEQTTTTFTDNVQTATAHYVRFLCTKGVDYTRGQASMAQGGIVYSESNPNDPYYIPPEVFNYLRNINEYTAFQGFNLDVKPKTSFFSKFLSNKGESNPLENYLQITNTIAGKGILIEKTHPVNIMGTVVTFNTDNNFITNEIITKKEYPNLKTLDSTILGAINELYSFSKITVDTDSFSLVSNFLKLNDDAISKRFNEVIEYPNLKTISKPIVGAINELKTSINDLYYQNNNFSFATKQFSAPDKLTTVLMGKMTIGTELNDIYTINSNNSNTIAYYQMKLSDLGESFITYRFKQANNTNGVVLNGTWTQGENLLMQVKCVDFFNIDLINKTYQIIFRDAISTNSAILTLDISPLLGSRTEPSIINPAIAPIMPQVDSKEYTFDPKSFKVENNTIELQDELIKERYGIIDKNLFFENVKVVNSLVAYVQKIDKEINLLKKQHNYFHFLSEKDSKANEIIILIGQITIGNDLEKNVYTIASNNVINPPESAKYGTMTYLDLGDEFNCYKLNSGIREINKKIKGVWKNTTDTLLSCIGIDVTVNFDTKIATIIFREVKDRPSPTTLTLDLSSL